MQTQCNTLLYNHVNVIQFSIIPCLRGCTLSMLCRIMLQKVRRLHRLSTWSLELITRNPESVLNSKSRESLEVPRTLGSPMVQGFAVQTCINMDREEFRLGTTKGQAKPLTINMGFQTEQNLHGKPQTPDSVSSAHQVSRGSGPLELSAGALPRYSANPALLRGVSSQSITVALPSISQPC